MDLIPSSYILLRTVSCIYEKQTSWSLQSLDGDGNGTAGDDYLESVYVAIPGDANLDGTVSVLGDAFILVSNLGLTGNVWTDGDFNADGGVTVLGDAFILVSNLGRSVLPPVSPALFASTTSSLMVPAVAATSQVVLASKQSIYVASSIDADKEVLDSTIDATAADTLSLAGVAETDESSSSVLDAAFASADTMGGDEAVDLDQLFANDAIELV